MDQFIFIPDTYRSNSSIQTDILFEQYQLDKLQAAVCIYFFYNEFMENARQCFQEA